MNTPNTASNSSMASGSAKNIVIKSKLNTKSSIYKANPSKSQTVSQVYPNVVNKASNMYPQPSVIGDSQNFRKINPGYYDPHYPPYNSQLINQMNYSGKNEQYMPMQGTRKLSDTRDEFTAHHFGMLPGMPQPKNPNDFLRKDQMLQMNQKFSSDTKIFPQKNFALFGENEHDNLEHAHRDESDEEGKMAQCIPSNIFEENEYSNKPTTHRHEKVTTKELQQVNEND